MKTLYCHGLPGSAAEIAAIAADSAQRPHVLAPLNIAGFDEATSEQDGAHVIGFSLGAMSALHIAAARPRSIKSLSLIAPAAPLELGDFLPHMAGAPVFKMAMKGDLAFKVFTAAQRLGVKLAPRKVIAAIFEGSPKADLDLLNNSEFEAALVSGLKSSLGPNNGAYHRAVRAYVQPWVHILKDIKCPVTIYHGAADNWAPLAMSGALKAAIASPVKVRVMDGLGHYSALHAALPQIIAP